jgi:hypothetical protein
MDNPILAAAALPPATRRWNSSPSLREVILLALLSSLLFAAMTAEFYGRWVA